MILIQRRLKTIFFCVKINIFETLTEIIKDLLIEDLQEIDKRFDIVISSEVIEHVEEPWAFTAYCSNLVKEDGDLIMTTVNRTQDRLLN